MEYIRSTTTATPPTIAPAVDSQPDSATDPRQWGAEPDTVYWDWDDVLDEPEEVTS